MPYSKPLKDLLDKYKDKQEPISVNFRELVPSVGRGERLSHLLHPYPAKLLANIPIFFLQNDILSKPGDVVVDPFSGSGTVLLEAIVNNRIGIGADSSPMARLIAKVKTTPIDIEATQKMFDAFKQNLSVSPTIPKVTNIKHWFYPRIIEQLGRIKSTIDALEDSDIKDFFSVCFSGCVRKVSLANPRLSVPVRLKKELFPKGSWRHDEAKNKLEYLKTASVIEIFEQIYNRNLKRISSLRSLAKTNIRICKDARNLSYENKSGKLCKIKNNSVSLVITSPPYAGAQKYIRSLSLSLGWLGFCDEIPLTKYKEKSIGREEYKTSAYIELLNTGIPDADVLLKEIYQENPKRAHIAANYLNEMRQSFKELKRVLKPGGHFVLVIANNQVCGREFKTTEYLEAIAHQLGFKTKLRLVDDIKSWGLMTKRNKTASTITCEWIFVLEKRGNCCNG